MMLKALHLTTTQGNQTACVPIPASLLAGCVFTDEALNLSGLSIIRELGIVMIPVTARGVKGFEVDSLGQMPGSKESIIPLGGGYYYCSHFTDKETSLGGMANLCKVTLLKVAEVGLLGSRAQTLIIVSPLPPDSSPYHPQWIHEISYWLVCMLKKIRRKIKIPQKPK